MITEKIVPTIKAVEPLKTPYQLPIKGSETARAGALTQKSTESAQDIVKGNTFSVLA